MMKGMLLRLDSFYFIVAALLFPSMLLIIKFS